MAYPHNAESNSHGLPQIPVTLPRGGQYPQYENPIPKPGPTANGLAPMNGNAYHATSQHDSIRTVVTAEFQHRQPVPQQQIPQRAYAVSIPPQPPFVDPSKLYIDRQSTAQSSHSAPPLDYQLLLLSLAEEYFAAAYGHGSITDILHRENEMQNYYKLIATGLGCLEAVLKRYTLPPEREAVVRLRYATVLYEETENTMEAEESLSKGISICDRHRFFDLKYDMQHLLARILFQKNPRAAFKFLDGVTKDAEAYQHVAWVYAFRFLKVSLHLELSSHQDLVAALSQLKHVLYLSNHYGDKTVLAIATTLEALTSLKVSNDAESIEQAQRALAGVRSLQLDPKIGQMHQLAILTSFVDLCCHLQNFEPAQVLSKMHTMQNTLKNVDHNRYWTADGSFAIPIPNARMPSCKSRRAGIVRKEEDSSLVLIFNWLPREDICTVEYLLSGLAMSHRNMLDGQKSEHILEEGIRRLECASSFLNLFEVTNYLLGANRETSKVPKSITLTSAHQQWREEITAYMRLHLAFTLCRRTSWSSARQQQAEIRKLQASMAKIPEPILLLTAYLEGVICQGTGDIENALAIYQSPTLSIHEYRKKPHPSHTHLDIALLTALNTLLIIRTPTHPLHHTLPALLSFIEHLCLRNPNRQIQAAFHLISATISSSSTILLTKQSLQSALQLAKQTENKHLICMVLTFMSWKFFRGVVGEQAEKSAKASQTLAQQCKDSLWMSVSAGVFGDTLEAAGRIEEAKRARENGLITARSLPEGLQLAMQSSEQDGGADVTMSNNDSHDYPPVAAM